MFLRKKKAAPAKPRVRNTPGFNFDLGIPGFDQNQQEDDADLEAELMALTGGRKAKKNDLDLTGDDDDDDDDDLEAELARIIGGNGSKQKKQRPTAVSTSGINSLSNVSDSVDLGSDEEPDVDENDPELLNELLMLTTDKTEMEDKEVIEDKDETEEEEQEEEEEIPQVELIRRRLQAYKTAETKAKLSNESSRARRFSRGIKTLEKLLKSAERGEIFPYDEIPPDIATNLKPVVPTSAPDASSLQNSTEIVPAKSENEAASIVLAHEDAINTLDERIINLSGKIDKLEVGVTATNQTSIPVTTPEKDGPADNRKPILLSILNNRRDEYRKLALSAKKLGDIKGALESVRAVKACDKLIELYHAGKDIAEMQIPPSPNKVKKPLISLEPQQRPASSNVPYVITEVFSTPKTVKEALEQRLNYFTKALRKAEAMGLRSDLRRLENIIKVYQNAIVLHQKGGNVPYEKLPTPPGCPPIPLAFKVK